MSNINEVYIHSHLAIKGLHRPAIKLWYVCRGLDSNGSGRAMMQQSYILELLDISRPTLYRYLKDQVLFRFYKSRKGELIIYYNSAKKVSKELDVDLGPRAIGIIEDDIVKQAVQIQAISLQQQSFYLANRDNSTTAIDYKKCSFNKKGDFAPKYNKAASRHKIVNPINCYFDEEGNPKSPSSLCQGVLDGSFMPFAKAHELGAAAGVKEMQLNNGYKYLQADYNVLPYGGSIKGIAKRLGISIKAVTRRLKDLPKVRIAYKSFWSKYKEHLFDAAENLGKALEHGYIINPKTKEVFKWGTYLYYPLYQLKASRY